MRAAVVAVAWLAACGGEDVSGPLRGTVTIVTEPGARVDFMSAVTDAVILTDLTDASGRVSTLIDRGDRAVIVLQPASPSSSPIVVLDELIPEQEYHWYLGSPAAPLPVSVIVSWPTVAGASYFQVESRCGGSMGTIGPSPATVAVCADGDAMLIAAFDNRGDLLASAYQLVSAPAELQMIAITEPFQPPRQIGVSLRGVDPEQNADAFGTLYTAEGVTYQIQAELSTAEPARLPDLDGTLRMHAMVLASPRSIKNVILQSPIQDAVTLDFVRRPLPDLVSTATFHAEGRLYTWTVSGAGAPDASIVELRTVSGSPLTVVAPYRAPRLHVPPLFGDLPEPAVAAENNPVMFASPGGYPAAISAYGRRNDPARPSFELYLSTYLPGT